MNNEFPDKEDDIWEMFKPKIMERLKGTIVYIDIKHNQKIMNRLYELYPDDKDYSYELDNLETKGFRYGWSLDWGSLFYRGERIATVEQRSPSTAQ